MGKSHADPVIAGILTLLGAAMAIYSVRYTIIGEGGRIGPGFMPFVAGIALALFAAWACAETVLRQRRARARESINAADRPRLDGAVNAAGAAKETPAAAQRPGRKLATVFALTVAAAALAPLTGFLVAFGLLILALLAGVEREPLWLAGVITVAAVAVSWLVFVQLLGVPLPGGAIGLLGT